MRSVLVPLLALCLAVVGGAPAAAGASAGPVEPVSGAEGEIGVDFHFKAGGFRFTVGNNPDDVENLLTLRVSGRSRFVEYAVNGQVSESGIEAKFGKLGKFSLAFEPLQTRVGETPAKCEGEPRRQMKGVYVGSFRFRGERGYVEVERRRIEGWMHIVPPRYCPTLKSAGSFEPMLRPTARGEELAVLGAGMRSRNHAVGFGVIASRDPEEPRTVFIANTYDVGEGMRTVHYAAAAGRHASFRFDLGEGTAAAKPPYPFQGWARFRRGPQAHNSWRGTLRVRMLGIAPVDLVGPRFRARITNEYNDE